MTANSSNIDVASAQNIQKFVSRQEGCLVGDNILWHLRAVVVDREINIGVQLLPDSGYKMYHILPKVTYRFF